jgi:hypothetical protein
VVAVADGDTITVLRDRTKVKVRRLEIDAPEKAQAFGAKSKESLSEMCFGKTAELADKDRCGQAALDFALRLLAAVVLRAHLDAFVPGLGGASGDDDREEGQWDARAALKCCH